MSYQAMVGGKPRMTATPIVMAHGRAYRVFELTLHFEIKGETWHPVWPSVASGKTFVRVVTRGDRQTYEWMYDGDELWCSSPSGLRQVMCLPATAHEVQAGEPLPEWVVERDRQELQAG